MTYRRAAYWAVTVAAALPQLGCGDDTQAIGRPVGQAEVREDGRIVLTGCPSADLIDARESYVVATPSGSCSTGELPCAVRTQQWCPGGTAGQVLGWNCRCENGGWNCSMSEKSGEYCPTTPSMLQGQEMKPCAYDPARRQAVACEAGSEPCEVTTIQQCPNGSQGKTTHYACSCNTYPSLAPDGYVWTCGKDWDDARACGANSCPVVSSYSVNRSQAEVGQRIELRVAARDDDGDDISYRWGATMGRLVNPYNRNTSYTCSVAGAVKLSVKASDGTCEDSMEVDVECTP